MFIIIHNKLINKCYFGTFGKHSVFGNGDVSNRKPNLRNWHHPTLWGRCDSTKPHWGCALFEPEVPTHALRVLTLEMDGLL